MNTIKNYIKTHKLRVISWACALVLIIGLTVVVNIISNSGSDMGEFPTYSKDETTSELDIPDIEADTTSETSSTSDTSSVDKSIIVTETPNNNTSKTSSSSTVSNSTSTVSTAPVEQVTTSSETTTTSSPTTTSSWTCPAPGTHGSYTCFDQMSHDDMIVAYERSVENKAKYDEAVANIPEGYNIATWCCTCNKPYGDGHNGTCIILYNKETGHYDHLNYD